MLSHHFAQAIEDTAKNILQQEQQRYSQQIEALKLLVFQSHQRLMANQQSQPSRQVIGHINGQKAGGLGASQVPHGSYFGNHSNNLPARHKSQPFPLDARSQAPFPNAQNSNLSRGGKSCISRMLQNNSAALQLQLGTTLTS